MNQKEDYLKSMGVDVEAGIANMMDLETYNEMLDDFYDSFDEETSAIDSFKNQGDMPNYAIKVHAMKSNARSFGFMKLGDIAYDHEMKSKANDTLYVNEHFSELENEVRNVINIITNYMAM